MTTLDITSFLMAAARTKLGGRKIELARLRLVDGLSYPQITARTGVGREHIRQAAARVRRELPQKEIL